jgi:ATP-dependent DNA helicase RecQ
VIHGCLPEGPARWYQEIGRASRDGHQGLAVCLFTEASDVGPNDVDAAERQATRSWLSRDLAEKRWRAMLEAPVSSRFEDGRERLVIDLDSIRVGLSVLQDSDYNRGWNMALLNLMQRAGALEVSNVSVADDGVASFVWEVSIIDQRVLNPDDVAAWDDIFDARNAELAAARRELNAFVEMMTHPTRRCLTAAVFELIEPETGRRPPRCGRCPACRRNNEPAPLGIVARGLERAWAQAATAPTVLPAGLLIVDPQDPDYEGGLELLLNRLVDVGVEQFIVSGRLASRSAVILAGSAARWGLVLTHEEWSEPPPASLAVLPTALLAPADDPAAERMISRLRQYGEEQPALPLVIVAKPERELSKRRIDQAYSRFSPYTEGVLEELARPERAQ